MKRRTSIASVTKAVTNAVRIAVPQRSVSDREWLRRAASNEPVGDQEFREAYEWFERDPHTLASPCGDSKPHGDHLWRHVYVPGGPAVDESMKKCPGRP